MTQIDPIFLIIPQNMSGLRFDQVLQRLLPDYSRSRLQEWVKEGLVLLDGQRASSKQKVWGGERTEVRPQADQQENAFKAEEIALSLVYEDEHLLVIDKPAGLVVHPAAGNWEGTMLNALLHHAPQLDQIPRAGIVHRLDKDTSGLLVVAKTIPAQTDLVRQLQARTVKREYRAVVWGLIGQNGVIEAPVGRHPRERTRMAVVQSGKPAMTHFAVLERFTAHTYLRCRLETGRTHQIRVHMQSIGHCIVGDPVYGRKGILKGSALPQSLMTAVKTFPRQALHAARLGLIHPASGEQMLWAAELPDDMKRLLEVLRADQVGSGESEESNW